MHNNSQSEACWISECTFSNLCPKPEVVKELAVSNRNAHVGAGAFTKSIVQNEPIAHWLKTSNIAETSESVSKSERKRIRIFLYCVFPRPVSSFLDIFPQKNS